MSLVANADDEEGPLSDLDLVFETMLVLVGGDETTRHVISGGVEALLRHPDQLARLCADPALLPGAIEEMLRWVSPIRNMNRTATADVEVHGQQVREGDRILLLYPSANRDETVFEDPARFDITRTPNDHVSFGAFGRHHCLGAPLARLELRVLFEELLTRLSDLQLATDADLPRRRGNFVLGFEHVPVTFTAAHRSPDNRHRLLSPEQVGLTGGRLGSQRCRRRVPTILLVCTRSTMAEKRARKKVASSSPPRPPQRSGSKAVPHNGAVAPAVDAASDAQGVADLVGEVGAGGETHQTAATGQPRLTTQQGVPVSDDQNTLREVLEARRCSRTSTSGRRSSTSTTSGSPSASSMPAGSALMASSSPTSRSPM